MEDDCDTTIKNRFQEPQKRFWLRSRKRRNSDAASVSSMDISISSETSKKKKRRRITEVASSFFSSSVPTGSKLGNALHRSFSSQNASSNLSLLGEETILDTTGTMTRNSNGRVGQVAIRSWIVDIAEGNVGGNLHLSLSRREVKRQEAIYELCCGEDVLLRDLLILKDLYYQPLLHDDILTPTELRTLFGDISSLILIHSQLRDELVKLRDESGCTEAVGTTLINWLPSLVESYVEWCRSQVWARHLLEEKRKTSKRFQEFLKKRLDSPRSVDLWTYLDVPRSRIVKYPLLVNEIKRHTPLGHSDQLSLKKASEILSELLKEVDQAMGDSECKLAQSRISVRLDYDPMKLIESAKELITEGQLKDAKGAKLHCFLFDTCFALTRPVRRSSTKYNLAFPVIPSQQIQSHLQTNIEGKTQAVGFKMGAHLLTSEDEHSKRHWIDSFRRVIKLVSKSQAEKNFEDEKENNVDLRSPRSKQLKRRSMSNLCENHFSLSLRKSLLRQKRNSIGFIEGVAAVQT